jgi:hypothetical protein
MEAAVASEKRPKLFPIQPLRFIEGQRRLHTFMQVHAARLPQFVSRQYRITFSKEAFVEGSPNPDFASVFSVL